MHLVSAEIIMRLPQADSLKDKRQVAKSVIDRVRRRFNVSIAEVDTQDAHRTLTLGVALVSGSGAQAQRAMDEVLRYIEESTDAEVVEVRE